MKIHKLHHRQKLPITLEEAWEFITDPENLPELTPKSMNFEITELPEKPMYAGQILQYRLSPLPGIKIRWISEITQLKEKEYFVDDQIYGPYALWHHKHFIQEIDGGVEMEDLVHYKVSFGFLGERLHPSFIKPKLKEVFAFREKQLKLLFGEYKIKKL